MTQGGDGMSPVRHPVVASDVARSLHASQRTMSTATTTGVKRLRILVVDDDAEMRLTLRRVLEDGGHEVVESSRADEVEHAVASEGIQAVILDKEMPGLGGLDVLPALREAHERLPVILITAFGGEEVERRARRLGATYYLEKPFRLAALMALLRRIAEGEPASGDGGQRTGPRP
jgi:DNA-binding NtrC family response regulator